MKTQPNTTTSLPIFHPLRLIFAAVLVALPPALVLFRPAFGQSLAYHNFVDQRAWHGLPNALDVLTNLPFLLVGWFGLHATLRQPATASRVAWFTFFGGVGLVALGSGAYHFAPDNTSLLWDRLPMTVAFMSLFAGVLGETLSERLGRRALLPLLLLGVASVFWWQRHDDLRPYFAVQALALAGIPTLLTLFPRAGTGRRWLVAGLGCYALAVTAERTDARFFNFTHGLLSGHSLKHLLAALACLCVAAMIHTRRTATP